MSEDVPDRAAASGRVTTAFGRAGHCLALARDGGDGYLMCVNQDCDMRVLLYVEEVVLPVPPCPHEKGR